MPDGWPRHLLYLLPTNGVMPRSHISMRLPWLQMAMVRPGMHMRAHARAHTHAPLVWHMQAELSSREAQAHDAELLRTDLGAATGRARAAEAQAAELQQRLAAAAASAAAGVGTLRERVLELELALGEEQDRAQVCARSYARAHAHTHICTHACTRSCRHMYSLLAT